MVGDISVSSRETQSSLNEFGGQMSSIEEMTSMIASASEEQSVVTAGVRGSMQKMHDGAQDLADHAQDLEQTIKQLTSLERNLRKKIAQFKY